MIAPSGGFTTTVNLTCAITPATTVPPTCKFSSASVAGASGTSMLTVSTAAAVAALRPANGMRSVFYAMLLPLCGITLLGSGFTSRRRKLLGLLLVCLMMAGLIFMTACGGGSAGGGGNGGGTPGTTAGPYTVTVTATAGTQTQTQSLAVTVQ
jgi:trimeric autotransporter adhesin